MTDDRDLDEAHAEATRLVAQLRQEYAASGEPSSADRKTVYVVTGCTRPGGAAFGPYQSRCRHGIRTRPQDRTQ